MRTSHLAAAAALVLVPCLPRAAPAQASTSSSVGAVVFVSGIAPLSAAGVNDLQFGTITAGNRAAPASLASDAGRFVISGHPGMPVNIDFLLAGALVGGGGNLQIDFDPSDALVWTAFPIAFTRFDPRARAAVTLDGNGLLVIGIAGSVLPALSQLPGLYTGTITLEVSY